MPKSLPNRLDPDSVAEFTAAARVRFDDGVSLNSRGRRTGAIYLWGYTAEMLLKAAYFRAIGFNVTRQITLGDLRNAVNLAPSLGVIWVGNFHSVLSWSRLLVARRGTAIGVRFRSRVLSAGAAVQRSWNETLRYHKNQAYAYELRQVETRVSWLLTNSARL